ncbi:LSU ribosomal protein L9P [Desulfonauticus submarinus]|uniref:Large ribosomal subunit protein bL9 n=1 Tax=Desulfonauticus submarinus TaxID=206665 RepID=A0A1G9ZGP4_9BACT|nr:50S ribosomal protein L9 [Desulfonauticus submarinus]SDN20414.1 LSU ribosomal protein L9P [Desulfonauticus submarinus]
MQVVLRADIENLGRLGDVVNVKPGYARNYLIPKGLAMLATDKNLKRFEREKKKLQEKMDAIRFAAQELADKLNALEVVLPVRVGEGDKLYGAVTAANIADKVAELGYEVDKRKILIKEPIRALGEYELEVKLHPDVRATLKVKVIKHGSEQAQEEGSEE